jgi:hypothetical protein
MEVDIIEFRVYMFKEVGLGAQVLLTILSSVVKIIGENLYGHLRKKFLNLTMNNIFTCTPEYMRTFSTWIC